jgi:N-glycosylase/DNA lyase
MQSSLNPTLCDVLNEYEDIESTVDNLKNWIKMSEDDLWRELCRCILSSNVPYELALSALSHLIEKGFLDLEWAAENPDSKVVIANELSKPVYLPLKINGTGRKYRFPNIRSKNITEAAKVVFSDSHWFHHLLEQQDSEKNVREILASKIPGIGLKEASHFLRDTGYSKNLAIIDTHIVAFLREIDVIPDQKAKTINREVYMELESLLEGICKDHNVTLSLFDMAIWRYMRKR